jgi:polar amino acid transport system permease protein
MDPISMITQFWPKLLHGLGLTIALSGAGFLMGLAIALPISIWRQTAGKWSSWPLRIYISFMRGTPLLAQLFLVYYGSGQFRAELQSIGLWSFFRQPINCALLVFVLNTAAYQMEIFRGGLTACPRGEVEAARALGMSPILALRRVILPNVFRLSLPALGNEVILLVKASAVASVITIFDLMGETRAAFAKTFDFSIYIWAAVLYLILTFVFGILWRQLERMADPAHYKRAVTAS